MKKLCLLLALLLALALLGGCGKHEHEWKDATCEEPETCTSCGQTRGEPLGHLWRSAGCEEPETCVRCGQTRGKAAGHDWQAASCEEPETCARCGQIRGEPLGHDWQAASCEAPETCARCGQTRGEPLGHEALPADYWSDSVCARCGKTLAPKLTPDFVSHGLDGQFMEEGKRYKYRTACYKDESLFTVGKAKISSYEITPGDGEELEIREGYEWRVVKVKIAFSDENANDYGISVSRCVENYYDVREHEDSLRDEGDFDGFDLTWKGQTYHCRQRLAGSFGDWKDGSCVYTCRICVQVPVGFDGMVVVLYNSSIDRPDGTYIYDIDNSDSLFFRMS